MLDLASLRALLGVPPLSLPDSWTPAAVVIDSRQARPGGLFVALAGQHSDGHDFLPAAFAGGCEAALVSRMPADPGLAARCLRVDHTGIALDGIAGLARRRYRGPVAAITGSNGKTTTKQLVRGILEREGHPGASPGNLNSTVGAPLAFLNHSADTDCWIQETGASDFGEIARICAWLQPDAGVITSIGEAHLETFGDLAGVLRAKSELLDAVAGREGRILLNTGDPLLATLAGRWPGAMEFGLEQGLELAEGHLCFNGLGEDGCGRFRLGRQDMALAVPGLAFAECALCAAALAASLGSGAGAILAGLAGWSDPGGAGGRMRVIQRSGVRILDDCYNANPASTRAALRTLAAMAARGRRWAVLGHMAELGPEAEALHRATGARAAEAGLDHLLAVGPRAELDALLEGYRTHGGRGGLRCPDFDTARSALDGLAEGDLLLVKGSRSAGLETLIGEQA